MEGHARAGTARPVVNDQLQERTVRRALILSFNSGYPFAVGYRLLGVRTQP
jgi:hypothetical protein